MDDEENLIHSNSNDTRKPGYDNTSHLILSNGLASMVYTLLLILLLILTEQVMLLASYSALYISMIFVLAEVVKEMYNRHLSAVPIKTSANPSQCLQTVVVSLVLFYVIPVLFGAPVYQSFVPTMMFSVLVTVTTTVPALVHLSFTDCLLVFTTLTSFDYSLTEKGFHSRNVQTTLLGAWANAIWIPLDWDREWQFWPIPCAVGIFVGFCVGNALSALLVIHQRVHRSLIKFAV